MKHTKSLHYKGQHLGFNFEIVNWSFDSTSDALDKWNYYVYIIEHATEDFARWWLEGTVKMFNEQRPSSVYMSYEYFASPLSTEVDWRGGVTSWEQLCLVGARYIKIGCDYSHLWDEGHTYTLRDVEQDCEATIKQLASLVKLSKKSI